MRQHTITKEEFLAAYDQYANAIYRHAVLRVGDKDRAVEIVHTVFARTWNYVFENKPIDNLKAFLFTVANNLIVDEYRRPKDVYLSELVEFDEDFDIPSKDETASSIEARSEIKSVIKVISELPPLYRQAITMRYLDGLFPQEIAKILNVSENVVSVRINRGVDKLKELMGLNKENGGN